MECSFALFCCGTFHDQMGDSDEKLSLTRMGEVEELTFNLASPGRGNGESEKKGPESSLTYRIITQRFCPLLWEGKSYSEMEESGLIAERNTRVAKVDAAQYHMLLAICGKQNARTVPTEITLN